MTAQQGVTSDPGSEPRVLVSAASRYGSTAAIAEAIGAELTARGARVTVVPPAEVTSVDDYDVVIIGSAVYAGHWLGDARDMAARLRDALRARSVWLFSSGPVGEPTGKLAKSMGQDPVEVSDILATTNAHGHRMFPGKLDRKNLHGAQRAGLLFFRGLQGDFRDWEAVREWADQVARTLPASLRGGSRS